VCVFVCVRSGGEGDGSIVHEECGGGRRERSAGGVVVGIACSRTTYCAKIAAQDECGNFLDLAHVAYERST
jgi:hypothetical protein